MTRRPWSAVRLKNRNTLIQDEKLSTTVTFLDEPGYPKMPGDTDHSGQERSRLPLPVAG